MFVYFVLILCLSKGEVYIFSLVAMLLFHITIILTYIRFWHIYYYLEIIKYLHWSTKKWTMVIVLSTVWKIWILSLVWQIQFCRISIPGRWRASAPSPPSSSTFLTQLPATSSQLLPKILGPEFPVCQEGTRPGTERSRFPGAASGQRLPKTSHPPFLGQHPSLIVLDITVFINQEETLIKWLSHNKPLWTMTLVFMWVSWSLNWIWQGFS